MEQTFKNENIEFLKVIHLSFKAKISWWKCFEVPENLKHDCFLSCQNHLIWLREYFIGENWFLFVKKSRQIQMRPYHLLRSGIPKQIFPKVELRTKTEISNSVFYFILVKERRVRVSKATKPFHHFLRATKWILMILIWNLMHNFTSWIYWQWYLKRSK